MVLHLTRSGGRAIRDWIGAHIGQPVILDAPHRPRAAMRFRANCQKISDKPVIANIEDMSLEEAQATWESLQGVYFEQPQETVWITVIRDPINLIPSRLEYNAPLHFRTNRREIDRRLFDTWLNHVVNGPHTILYDTWFRIPEAYFPMMQGFGLNPVVKHLEYFPEGQESSFEGHAPNGQCSKMNTLERYKGYEKFLLKTIPQSVARTGDQFFPNRPLFRTLTDNMPRPQTFEQACSW
jgi:hypothetical protein